MGSNQDEVEESTRPRGRGRYPPAPPPSPPADTCQRNYSRHNSDPTASSRRLVSRIDAAADRDDLNGRVASRLRTLLARRKSEPTCDQLKTNHQPRPIVHKGEVVGKSECSFDCEQTAMTAAASQTKKSNEECELHPCDRDRDEDPFASYCNSVMVPYYIQDVTDTNMVQSMITRNYLMGTKQIRTQMTSQRRRRKKIDARTTLSPNSGPICQST